MKALDAAALAHRADDGNIRCPFLLGTQVLMGAAIQPGHFKAFDGYAKAAPRPAGRGRADASALMRFLWKHSKGSISR